MTGLAVGLLLSLAAAILWQGPASRVPAGSGRTTGEKGATGRAGATGDGMSSRALGPGIRDPALMLDLSAAMLSSGRPLSTVLLVLGETADPPLGAVLRRVVTALELGAGWEQAWALGVRAGGRASKDAVPTAALLGTRWHLQRPAVRRPLPCSTLRPPSFDAAGRGKRSGVRQHLAFIWSCRWGCVLCRHSCVSP